MIDSIEAVGLTKFTAEEEALLRLHIVENGFIARG